MKQAVLVTFMLVFLLLTLVLAGGWFHFKTEVDLRSERLKVLTTESNAAKERARRLGVFLGGDAKARAEVQRQLEVLQQSGAAANAPEVLKLKTQLAEVQGLEPRRADAQKRADERQAAAEALQRENETYKDSYMASWGEKGQVTQAWETVLAAGATERVAVRRSGSELAQEVETSRQKVEQREAELRAEMAKEEQFRKDNQEKRQKMDADLAALRIETEDADASLTRAVRNMERKAKDAPDGHVIFSSPEQAMVTVDIGSHHGAYPGLKFMLFSGRHSQPVIKAQVQFTTVRQETSDGVVMQFTEPPLYDPQTGWEAPDPRMKYSVFVGTGQDNLEPQPLMKRQSQRDMVEQLRQDLARRQKRDVSVSEAQSTAPPPLLAGSAFEPVVPGDWLSSPDFTRIVPDAEFYRRLQKELVDLSNVSLSPRTFCFTDGVRRRDFLKAIIERNRSKVASEMSPDVTCLITTADAANVAAALKKLEGKPDEKLSAEEKKLKSAVTMVQAATKAGVHVLTEDQLEEFFQKRQRKLSILTGNIQKPGVPVFFVAGRTRYRNSQDTAEFIREHGGLVADSLNAKVDFVLVGLGLETAKVDKATGRIYEYEGLAPAGAVPFYDYVKTLGIRVMREDELYQRYGKS